MMTSRLAKEMATKAKGLMVVGIVGLLIVIMLLKSHKAVKTIYFIPIGDFPSGAVKQLVSYYHDTFHLEIETADAIPIEDAVVNTERGQLEAEKLIASMRHALPKLANDPNAILIGFTTARYVSP